MKRLLNKAIILAMLAVTWVGCSQDEVIVDFEPTTAQESESDIHINLNLNIPDPVQVTSRAGVVTEAIENIAVLCFDKNDKALAKLDATFQATNDEAGTLTVKIPNATRVMHVFANQETIPFEKGMSEYADELKNLAATSGTMVYWARIEVPSTVTTTAAVKDWWAEQKTISLLRNHAKVVVENNTSDFVLQGYTVINTHASGLALPYYAKDGVYPTNALGSTPTFSVNDWITTNYIHAATGNQTVSGTDETLQTEGAIYVYETSANTPASIIIKGYNTSDPDKQSKYWRVAFADEEGNQLDIRRNHCYTVSIEGSLLNGDNDFASAVANSSTANSAWLSIADEVTALKNKDFSMTVENTSYVFTDGKKSFSFNFEIEQLGDEAFKASDLSVKWEDGQNVSEDATVNYTSTTADGKFKATVNVSLKALAAGVERQEGTIVIKYGKKLQRKVNVIVIPQQEFNLVSYNDVSTYVEEDGALVYEVSVNKADYEKDDYTIDGAPIDKLTFKIPNSFPAQLLPVNVLVSTTDFNVVNSPLIFEGEGGYGEANGIGYKYVYPVSAVATEYVINLRYINNVLADKVELTLEAANFKKVKLIVKYTLNSDQDSDTEG